MGKEIDNSHFRHKDFQAFEQRLTRETQLLAEWFATEQFQDKGRVAGFELELWLVNRLGQPVPENAAYLARSESLGLPMVSELSKFNLELNTTPRSLSGAVLSQMHQELHDNWQACRSLAQTLDSELMMIGILPSLAEADLSLANMSEVKRFRALNEQVLRLREGRPLHLNIEGREHLRTYHLDVMLESAATSFQIHYQTSPERSARAYNAAHILSAPMVAISANSPYLFGSDLWDETRIPVFEQAVAAGGFTDDNGCEVGRVGFGCSYVQQSLFECFERNLERYPILLPAVDDAPAEAMSHLSLHNGTIWRWNRPLIGFDEHGRPHLRIEHRVVPAGPSVIDAIANAAFFYGLVEAMSQSDAAPEAALSFEHARSNFYSAAKHGLAAQVMWLDGKRVSVYALLLQQLLPMAREGLRLLDVDACDIDNYLGVIEGRLRNKRNGANWQRDYVARHGHDMSALTLAYHERQNSGAPVHEWSL